jgi:hypothetical protein
MELMELPEQLETAGTWKGRPNDGEIALSRRSCSGSEENERRTGGKGHVAAMVPVRHWLELFLPKFWRPEFLL